MFRHDRDSILANAKRRGGVAIAVRRELNPNLREGWNAPVSSDHLWISVPLASKGNGQAPAFLHICCAYIPHSSRHESDLGFITESVNDLIELYSDDMFLITGDFNVSHAIWCYDAESNSMVIRSESGNE